MFTYANQSFVKDVWYPIALEWELDEAANSGKALERYLIGQRLCVFRGEDGAVGVLNDICPHNGAKLSNGPVVNGCIQCPYHDQRFDRSGRCTLIPSLGVGGKIPAAMQTDSYLTQVKYGIVWVFMGDKTDGEHPPILEVPEFAEPSFKLQKRLKFTWRCSVLVATENLLDSSHFCHAHKGSFGNGNAPLTKAPEFIDRGRWGATAQVKMLFSEQNPMFPEAESEYGPNPEISVISQFTLPTTVVIRFDLQKPGAKRWCDLELFALAPGKGEEVNIYWVELSTRTDVDEAEPHRMTESAAEFLREDEVIVQDCCPELLPAGGVPVKVDRFVRAYRTMYQNYLAEHGITQFIYTKRSGEEMVIIPSPARNQVKALACAWASRSPQTGAACSSCSSCRK